MKKRGINYILIAIIAVICITIIIVSTIIIKNISAKNRELKEQIEIDISTFQGELQDWIAQKKVVAAAKGEEFNTSNLNADSNRVTIGDSVYNNISIYNIIKSLSTTRDGIYINNLVIVNGKLSIVDEENIVQDTLTKKQIKFVKEALEDETLLY